MRAKLSKLYVTVVALICASVTTVDHAAGQRRQAPFGIPGEQVERMLAGEALEQSMDRALRSCGVNRVVARVGLARPEVTRIPPILLDVSVSDSVRRLRAASLPLALSYVARTGEDPVKVTNPQLSRHLRLDPQQSPALMIPVGENRLVYTFTCASAVEATANVGINVTNVVTAAATGMQRNANNLSVAVAEGRFYSPIAKLLASNSVDGFFGRMLIWDWYRANPTLVDSGGTYREQLRGIVIARLFTTQMAQELRASAEAGASLGFVSLSGRAQGSIVRGEGGEVQRYLIWEYATPRDTVYLKKLPTTAVLNTEMQQILNAEPVRESDRLIRTLPYMHSFRVDGFPPDYCVGPPATVWRIGGPFANNLRFSMRRDNSGQPSGNPWVSCMLDVVFTAPDSLWREPYPSDLTLEYTLVSTAGRGTDTAQLTLPFAIRVRMVDHPRVAHVSSVAPWARLDPSTATPQVVTWSGYVLSVEDTENRVDWVNFDPGAARASIGCPRLDNPAVIEQIGVSIAGPPQRVPGSNFFNFEFRSPFPAGASTSVSDARNCTLQGTVTFVLANGQRATKTLPTVTLRYPGAATTQQ